MYVSTVESCRFYTEDATDALHCYFKFNRLHIRELLFLTQLNFQRMDYLSAFITEGPHTYLSLYVNDNKTWYACIPADRLSLDMNDLQ